MNEKEPDCDYGKRNLSEVIILICDRYSITVNQSLLQTRLLHLQLYRTHKASIITIIIQTLILNQQNSLRQTKDQLQDINNL
jgi:hypothetical protein